MRKKGVPRQPSNGGEREEGDEEEGKEEKKGREGRERRERGWMGRERREGGGKRGEGREGMERRAWREGGTSPGTPRHAGAHDALSPPPLPPFHAGTRERMYMYMYT